MESATRRLRRRRSCKRLRMLLHQLEIPMAQSLCIIPCLGTAQRMRRRLGSHSASSRRRITREHTKALERSIVFP
ncbi:hypothetical protein VTK56DRAFT_6003 [Thermocarpiscus australiensis]